MLCQVSQLPLATSLATSLAQQPCLLLEDQRQEMCLERFVFVVLLLFATCRIANLGVVGNGVCHHRFQFSE